MDAKLLEIKHLHDMGFAILPLHPKSKRPIQADWTKGERISFSALQKTFRVANNYGVRLGTPSELEDGSYLCVIDCDLRSSEPEHVKEFEDSLEAAVPIALYAPRVISGSGGGSFHIYLRTKEPQKSFKMLQSKHIVKTFVAVPDKPSQRELSQLTTEEITKGMRLRPAWELDVFGDGKQVVIPPSIHPSGKAYAWEEPLRAWDSVPLVKNFVPNKLVGARGRGTVSPSGPFKAEDVDLLTLPLSEKHFDLVVRGIMGDEYPSRSEATFGALNALVKLGLTDNQVLSIMSDPDNLISEKALEKGDREAAVRWLAPQLAKVREDRVRAAGFDDSVLIDDLDEPLSDEDAAAQEAELIPWTQKLIRTKNGDVKPTHSNVYMILKNYGKAQESDTDIYAYDSFSHSYTFARAAPWHKDDERVGKELVDKDDNEVLLWFSKEWDLEVPVNVLQTAVSNVAHDNEFHPVRRYLSTLKWDGVKRVHKLFSHYAGAVGDEAYIEACGVKFMAACVARVMSPGCKFDHVPILEGLQGLGKSSFVHILAGQWYSDSLGDIMNKDVIDNMRGCWIIELGELASMSRAEVNELKAFITRQEDRGRKAYARRSESYPRQCVFVGTTNDHEYLKDSTGGRRFWPINVFDIKFDALTADRDQLWAEAFEIYKSGEKLYLEDASVREYAEGEQRARSETDFIAIKIRRVIQEEPFTERLFSADEVWDAMAVTEGSLGKTPDRNTQIRIKNALRTIGCKLVRVQENGERCYKYAGPNYKGYDYMRESSATYMGKKPIGKPKAGADDFGFLD